VMEVEVEAKLSSAPTSAPFTASTHQNKQEKSMTRARWLDRCSFDCQTKKQRYIRLLLKPLSLTAEMV
jgi:hypothetical protein